MRVIRRWHPVQYDRLQLMPERDREQIKSSMSYPSAFSAHREPCGRPAAGNVSVCVAVVGRSNARGFQANSVVSRMRAALTGHYFGSLRMGAYYG